MKIKQVLIVLTIVIFFSVVSYWLGINQTGSFKDVLESQEHHSPPSVVIEPGSGVEEASYIIFKDDEGFVYAKSGDTGEIEFSGTDADEVINWALSGLTPGRTWQEKLILLGNFSIDSSIIVPSYTILELVGQVVLQPNSNCHILTNADHTNGNNFITIKGGWWEGKEVLQSSGSGFYFYTSSGNIENLLIRDVIINGTDDYGIYIHRGITNKITNVKIRYTREAACYLDVWSDSFLEYCSFGSWKNGILHRFGSSDIFEHVYLGGSNWDNTYTGQLHIESVKNCFYHDFIVDSSGRDGVVLKRATSAVEPRHNIFTNFRISRPHGEDSIDRYAVYFEDAEYNIFKNAYIGQKLEADDSNDDWLWAIYETGTSDYNLFETINAREGNCTNYFSLTGVNSQITNTNPKVENSGTVTGTSPITVPHSLVDIPSTVVVTPRTSCTFAVTSRDATNFVITHDGGSVTFDWYAEI